MRRIALVLLLVLIVPASEMYVADVSSDGTHVLKLVEEHLIYVDDSLVVNATTYYYSIDGNGEEIYALTDNAIDVYGYSGNLLKSIELETTEEYYFVIALYGDSYALAGMNFTEEHKSFIVYNGQTIRSGNNSYVLDMDGVDKYLGFLVSVNDTVYFYIYDGEKVELQGEYKNARYLLGFEDKFVIYDENLGEIGRISMKKTRTEPKPVVELSPQEATAAATGATTSYLALLYYIRERRLTSVTNIRRILRREFDKYLVIPIAGLIIELRFAPKDPLTLFVVMMISIGAAYSVYSIVTRNVKRKIFRLLVIYGFIASFLGLIAMTRRPAVIAFYALAGVYSFFRLRESV